MQRRISSLQTEIQRLKVDVGRLDHAQEEVKQLKEEMAGLKPQPDDVGDCDCPDATETALAACRRANSADHFTAENAEIAEKSHRKALRSLRALR